MRRLWRLEYLMKYIVGLGNPTAKYKNTRHNIGFSVVERVADLPVAPESSSAVGIPSAGVDSFLQRLLRYLSGAGGKTARRWHKYQNMLVCRVNPELTLLKPQTYMNLSGEVFSYLEDTVPENILVVVDDIYLPLGRMRFRSKGSAGGHNGLKSVEESLGSSLYHRVKIGVGRESAGVASEPENLIDFVLGEFAPEESELLRKVTDKSAQAVQDWYVGGIDYVQQQYNGIDLRF